MIIMKKIINIIEDISIVVFDNMNIYYDATNGKNF
jgi:hypothetical protein